MVAHIHKKTSGVFQGTSAISLGIYIFLNHLTCIKLWHCFFSIMRKPNTKIKLYLKYETTVNPNF